MYHGGQSSHIINPKKTQLSTRKSYTVIITLIIKIPLEKSLKDFGISVKPPKCSSEDVVSVGTQGNHSNSDNKTICNEALPNSSNEDCTITVNNETTSPHQVDTSSGFVVDNVSEPVCVCVCVCAHMHNITVMYSLNLYIWQQTTTVVW